MRVQRLNKKRFLGDLCVHGHGHEDTGKSIRYKNCNTCCTCNAISVAKRKKEHKIYRDTHKLKMKEYQDAYRKKNAATVYKIGRGRIYFSKPRSKRKYESENIKDGYV